MELRDYDAWHQAYDDPDSGLSWRLKTVQAWLRRALDERPGQLRVLSVCAGDGRDIIGVLAERHDHARIDVVLVELNQTIAERAERTARDNGLTRVEVRRADAGLIETYVGIAPVDIVLLVGIFGNISRSDVRRTVAWSARLCRPGASLIWSRGRDRDDINAEIRSWFTAAGFVEQDYAERDAASRPALGAVRFVGPPPLPEPQARLFTFYR